jgi:hypothetical protein
MSKLWGPLGWMTLHSVSLNYPETPSQIDKAIAQRFLEIFAETISCPYCKNHFIAMLAMYRADHPEMMESRQTFALFAFRAHNTVNRRLDKPLQKSVAECIQALKAATSQTSMTEFRKSYLEYLTKTWSRDFSADGFMIRRSIQEMKTINEQYWTPRETANPNILEADVLTPIEKQNVRRVASGKFVSSEAGFKGGKLKLKNY